VVVSPEWFYEELDRSFNNDKKAGDLVYNPNLPLIILYIKTYFN